MNNKLKQKIDNVWMQSDFCKWCKAVAKNDVRTANDISKQIFDSGYLMPETLEEELACKIAKLMKSESDINEYMQLLEKENSELVGVLIQQELFEMVSKHIKSTVK